MKCDGCFEDFTTLRCERRKWLCKICVYNLLETSQSLDTPLIISTVNLPDIGNVSIRRIDEARRRVILPIEAPPGEYYLGRRGENGKIQDREPTY